jgi:hypothetical protein
VIHGKVPYTDERFVQVFEIPSAAKAALKFVCYRRTEVPPLQNQNLPSASLAELLAEARDADRDQNYGEEKQAEKIWPEVHESAPLERASADDGSEVMDRVEHGERLQPPGHGLDGIERAG